MAHQDCGTQLMHAGAFTAIAGGIVGALQAAWTDKPMIKDQMTAHVRYAAVNMGRAATVFGASGAAYAGGSCFAAQFRNKDDPWNAVIGGIAGGAVLGVHLRSVPTALAALVLMGAIAGGVDVQARTYPHLADGRAVDIFKALKQKAQGTE